MLTEGVSVNSVTFRREGFTKYKSPNMSRRYIKNCVFLLFFISTFMGGYILYAGQKGSKRSDGYNEVHNMKIENKPFLRIPAVGSHIASEDQTHGPGLAENDPRLSKDFVNTREEPIRAHKPEKEEDADFRAKAAKDRLDVADLPRDMSVRNQKGEVIGNKLVPYGVRLPKKGKLGQDRPDIEKADNTNANQGQLGLEADVEVDETGEETILGKAKEFFLGKTVDDNSERESEGGNDDNDVNQDVNVDRTDQERNGQAASEEANDKTDDENKVTSGVGGDGRHDVDQTEDSVQNDNQDILQDFEQKGEQDEEQKTQEEVGQDIQDGQQNDDQDIDKEAEHNILLDGIRKKADAKKNERDVFGGRPWMGPVNSRAQDSKKVNIIDARIHGMRGRQNPMSNPYAQMRDGYDRQGPPDYGDQRGPVGQRPWGYGNRNQKGYNPEDDGQDNPMPMRPAHRGQRPDVYSNRNKNPLSDTGGSAHGRRPYPNHPMDSDDRDMDERFGNRFQRPRPFAQGDQRTQRPIATARSGMFQRPIPYPHKDRMFHRPTDSDTESIGRPQQGFNGAPGGSRIHQPIQGNAVLNPHTDEKEKHQNNMKLINLILQQSQAAEKLKNPGLFKTLEEENSPQASHSQLEQAENKQIEKGLGLAQFMEHRLQNLNMHDAQDKHKAFPRNYEHEQEANFQTPSGTNMRDLSMEYSSRHMCVPFKFPTGVKPLCIPNMEEDMDMADTILTTKEWQPRMMNQFSQLMKHDSSLNLVDIGAGIGVFTVAAAMMGRKVLAVEPLDASYLLLHETVFKSLMSGNVALVTEGVGSSSFDGYVKYSPERGEGYDRARILHHLGSDKDSDKNAVHVTTLSELSDNKIMSFSRALLLLQLRPSDTLKALIGGDTFFKKMDIPFVLMWWPEDTSLRQDIRSRMTVFGYVSQNSWNRAEELLRPDQYKEQDFIIWRKT